MISRMVLTSRANNWHLATLENVLRSLRYLKIIGLTVLGTSATIVALQLVYPSHWARPLVHLGKQRVSFWSTGKVSNFIADQANQPYHLLVSNKTYDLKPAALGISADTESTKDDLLHYSLMQRLVPLSLFFDNTRNINKTVNDMQLDRGLQAFADARAQDPTNATLQKNIDGSYKGVLTSKNGYKVNVGQLKDELTSNNFGSHIEAPLTAIAPAISQAQLQEQLNEWHKQTDSSIDLTIGSQTVTVAPETLRKWVSINTNTTQDAISIAYDKTAIMDWLNAYAPKVYSPPTKATQHLTDNVVTTSIQGVNGSMLDFTKTADNIIQAAKQYGGHAQAMTKPVAYSTQLTKSYSPTSQGLQLLIKDWAASHKGSFGVSFQEIGGQGRAASLNANTQFYTASIYKLFVADYIYTHIQDGNISPTLVLANGRTVNDCLEAMIVVSDNDCPHTFANLYGWSNIDALAKQRGFSATSLTEGNYYTTTADATNYLQRLYAGNLLNASNTAALLSKMSRQIYRMAIPAGSSGATVYDKVGFYGSYWNDAAVVKGPKATYSLVIFTNNSSAASIKDLAQQIQQTLGN